MSKPILAIGLPHFDDSKGLWFTLTNLRLHHAEHLKRCQLIIADNSFSQPSGQAVREHLKYVEQDFHSVKYVEVGPVVGSAVAKNAVFDDSDALFTLCMDCHIDLHPGVVDRVVDAIPKLTDDLYCWTIVYDDLRSISTHLNNRWRREEWGTWAPPDPRGKDPNGDPFEIQAMAMGMFLCRTSAWLGFNRHSRGFDNEQWLIHDKFRNAGRKCWCVPWLRGTHYFRGKDQPRPRYPIRRWDRVRNMMLGMLENGQDLVPLYQHFVSLEPREGESLAQHLAKEHDFNREQLAGKSDDQLQALHRSKKISQEHWEFMLADPVARIDPPKEECGGCEKEKAKKAAAEHGKIRIVSKQVGASPLEAIYRGYKNTPSAVNEHLPKLRELASKCSHVTEFGTGMGRITSALIAALPSTVATYDTFPGEGVIQGIQNVLSEASTGRPVNFLPHSEDVLSIDIAETDLLVIDTIHNGEQLSAELSRHAPQVSRWIAILGTQTWQNIGEGDGAGMLTAEVEFMQANPEWSTIYHTDRNNGLTILSKDPADKPPLPPDWKRLWNFAEHGAAHLLDLARKVSPECFEERLKVCATCPRRNGVHCSACGCPIQDKATWRTSECEAGKWVETV